MVPHTRFVLRIRVGFGLPGNTILFLLAEAAGELQDHLQQYGNVPFAGPFKYVTRDARLQFWEWIENRTTWGEMLAIISAVWSYMQKFNCFGSAVIEILDDGLRRIGHGTIGPGRTLRPRKQDRPMLARDRLLQNLPTSTSSTPGPWHPSDSTNLRQRRLVSHHPRSWQGGRSARTIRRCVNPYRFL